MIEKAKKALEAAKNPWIGVLLALIGAVHARVSLEQQKEITKQIEIKAKSIGTTVDGNDQAFAAENKRLRSDLADLAGKMAFALRATALRAERVRVEDAKANSLPPSAPPVTEKSASRPRPAATPSPKNLSKDPASTADLPPPPAVPSSAADHKPIEAFAARVKAAPPPKIARPPRGRVGLPLDFDADGVEDRGWSKE